MAELMEMFKDVPEAIKAYKKAAKADKKRPEPHERLETIYEKIGFDDLAEEEHEIAERLRKALYKSKTTRKKKWDSHPHAHDEQKTHSAIVEFISFNQFHLIYLFFPLLIDGGYPILYPQ